MTTKQQKQKRLIELKSISFQLIQEKMKLLIPFKWAKLLILFFLILGSNESLYSQTDEVMEGAVYFKIKPSTNIHLPTYNTGYTGTYPYFNHLISQFGITDIYKPFKHIDSVYFGYTYRIYLNKSSDIYQLIDSLENYSFVEFSEPVALYRTFYTPSDSLYNKQYYVNLIKADKAWNTTLGSNSIKIAVIDDGFRLSHVDLDAQYYINSSEFNDGIDNDNNGYIDDINGWDGADKDNDPSVPANLSTYKYFTHGTLVVGTISAEHNLNGISGIAPNCKFIPIKTKFTADSIINSSLFVDDGLAYSIATRADIVNMSWGSSRNFIPQVLKRLIDYGDSVGMLFVAAAGNNNNRGILNARITSGNIYPASYSKVISVASLDSNDIKSSFSNYGSYAGIDISAPGSDIITCAAYNNNSYEVVNGTSLACPIVTAVCALIKSQDSTLSNIDIKNCLYYSADKIDFLNDREFTGSLGAGRVNALGAINCTPNYNAHFTCLQGRLVGCTDSTFSFIATQYSNVEYHWTINTTTSINTYNNSRLNYQFAKAGVYSIQLEIVDLSNNVLDRKKYYNYISVKPCEEIKNKSNNVWHFGNKASLNFNDNSVKQRFDNQINYRGTNSIINNYNGRYLNSDDYVYAGWGEGINTYDSNFNAIDPFSTLLGAGNSIDFSKNKTNLMFVPDINNENEVVALSSTPNNLYYFSTGSSFDPANRLSTFKIFNNNNTDSIKKIIPPNVLGINIFPTADSSLITMDGIGVIPKDSCNGYWFYVQSYNDLYSTGDNSILQYSLDNNYKIDFVTSYFLPNCGTQSTMKFSKDGTKLGIFNDCNYRVYVFEVNRTNGVLTLIDSIKCVNNYFEFSPNGEIIYGSDSKNNRTIIYQYELKNAYDSAVFVMEHSQWDFLNLKLAPDNTIYINNSERDYLSAITFPDSVITDISKNQVGYIRRSIELNYKQSTNTRDSLIHSGFGLPQTLNDLNECLIDILPIIENCDSIRLTTNACGNSFIWQLNGLTKTGRTVTFYNPNLNTDTVYLTVRGKRVMYKPQLPPPVLNNDSLVIYTVPGTPAYLQKTNSFAYADYQWFKDGKHVYGCPTCSTYSTDKVGVYKVVASSTCGQSVSNTVEIKYNCNSLALNRMYYQPVGYNFNSGITNILAIGGTNAYLLKGKNIIGAGDSVYIQGTNILLESCAEIVVEKGGYLNVEYTNFVGCDNWQGITVLGDSNSIAGRNLGSSIHGSMYMKESSVSNANVGVYAINGGFVYLDSNEFIRNAYHIGFNDYKHSDYSIVFRNKLYPCSEFHDKIIVKATGVQKLCSAGRDDIPSDRKSYLFINKMKNTIIDFNYFIADIPYNDRHYNYYSAGIEVNNSKDLNISNNRFTNYFLNYDVYMRNTSNSSINGNEFIANFYGAPILDNQGLTNGVYMKECDSMQVQYNKFHNNVNGLEIYNRTYKATNKIIGNSIRENYIGLLLAPEKNPTNAYTGDNVSADSMNQFIYCNKFFDNKNGMIGSGNLRYQTGYNGEDWACKMDGNANWDILWDNGRCNINYFNLPIDKEYNFRVGQTKYPMYLNQIFIDSNKNRFIAKTSIQDPCGLNLKRQILNLNDEIISNNQIVLYPNPFEDVIYIKGLLDKANYQVKITDMNGKLIKIDYQINTDNASIDLRNLTKGIYTVTISSNDKIENVKIIKL